MNDGDEPDPLRLTNVSVRFGATQALRGVSFSLAAGEIRALLGHNGAGKSTLVRVASGIVRADAGEVQLLGVTPRNAEHARALGSRMVHQELSLVPTLSVADNLFLSEELRVGPMIHRRRQIRIAGEILQGLGIDLDVRRKVATLSRAKRQMVEIARAIRARSHVLLLDEPTAPLSTAEISMLFSVLRKAAAAGTAIVMITHHLGEIFEICDNVTVLRDGSVVLNAPIADLDRASVAQAVSGRRAVAAPPTTLSARRPTPSAELAPRPESERTLLSVTDLTVPGKLERVSFALRPGEIVGVVGLAGSGRSTLLKALTGAVPSYVGAMRFNGAEVGTGRSRARTLRGIFRLPEDRRTEGLLLDHSLALNVVLANLKGVSTFGVYRRRRARRIVSDYCRDLDIRHRDVTLPVRVLSGGNQQKAMLARALFVNPRVLLFDEPTFGVDVGASEDIVRFARGFCADGGAVVWVSSDFAEMAHVVDRVVVLAGGRISTPVVDRDASGPLREDDLLTLLASA